MGVRGITPGSGKNSNESGDWTVKTTSGVATDVKGKPLSGLSFASARVAARSFTSRTGEFAGPVRG